MFRVSVGAVGHTLGVIVRFSWEIGRRRFSGVERVQHNRCYHGWDSD